jgi:hypothetical protein
MFLAAFETTIAASTQSSVGSTFSATDNIAWVATSYLIVSTAVQPLYGRASDLFGRTKVYVFSLFFFAVGCLGCGISGSLSQMVAARAFCGIGGTSDFPSSMPLSGAKSIRGRSDYHLASVCLGRASGQISPAVPSSQQRDIRSRGSGRRLARRTALRFHRLAMGIPRSRTALLVLRLGLPSSGAPKAGDIAAGSKGFGDGWEGGLAGQRFAGEGKTLSLGTCAWLKLTTTVDAVHHALHAGDQSRRRRDSLDFAMDPRHLDRGDHFRGRLRST